jgi:hypothetical protein
MNNRFIHVLDKSIYPPQEKNPKGETHEDAGFFSYDKAAKKLMLRQFHIEGFVNQFALESVSDDGSNRIHKYRYRKHRLWLASMGNVPNPQR